MIESAQVEDGAEPTSALGSQEVMGIKSPLVLRQIDNLHGPLCYEGRNLFTQC